VALGAGVLAAEVQINQFIGGNKNNVITEPRFKDTSLKEFIEYHGRY